MRYFVFRLTIFVEIEFIKANLIMIKFIKVKLSFVQT